MDASPLAKLPPELRNTIYHEVLLQEDTIKLSFQPARNNNKSRVVLSTRRQNEFLALTLTCKPLRRETHDLFFAINSFEIEADGDASRSVTASIPIHRFLDGITTLRARSAIKSLALHIGLVGGVLEQVKELERELRDEEEEEDDDDDDDEDSEDDEVDEVEVYERTVRLEQLGLNQGFLKEHPRLPLQVKAICCFCGVYNGEREHVYIDLQNLTASIGLALERLRNWLQEELEYRRLPDDREMCQAEFDDMTGQLEACLQQIAATEEV
ncbi:hypothetical protein KC340_g13018 [Hortaea werneckii]|nr:hypothetical protein KC342_g13353 [Hortaea werneckii]KAI7301593.1 hypothetical protein KC340_g13018 [Hortaea werneckii]KAI7370350.1 hypothetical protein KC328_g17750 [Hortaea werneckii]